MSENEVMHYSAHEIDIHDKVDKLRLAFASFQAPSVINIFLTFISLGIIFIINRYMSAIINKNKANKVQKKVVLSVLTPRTIFDKLGLFTSNIFAFVIFPAFVVINVIIAQWVMKGGQIYEVLMYMYMYIYT
jgi:hypothetical protein